MGNSRMTLEWVGATWKNVGWTSELSANHNEVHKLLPIMLWVLKYNRSNTFVSAVFPVLQKVLQPKKFAAKGVYEQGEWVHMVCRKDLVATWSFPVKVHGGNNGQYSHFLKRIFGMLLAEPTRRFYARSARGAWQSLSSEERRVGTACRSRWSPSP